MAASPQTRSTATKLAAAVAAALEAVGLGCEATAGDVVATLGLSGDWDWAHGLGLAANALAARTIKHPLYGAAAGRLLLLANRTHTEASFSSYVAAQPNLTAEMKALVHRHAGALDAAVVASRDEQYTFFAWRTLEKSYLLRDHGTIRERPQYMWLRVAIGIHSDDDDLRPCLETYDALSTGVCTHATPTLFNAGTTQGQLASCFLVAMKDDSIDGIYDTLKECALISKNAGGIGLHIHTIRGKGAPIDGTNGVSNGIVPMLRNFNATARYVDQGGGKRKGSFAIFLAPHHPDILEFLELKLNHGADELRARDLFYGVWASDLFMRRVEEDGVWSLFCPRACPELGRTYGADFAAAYETYEAAGLAVKQLSARDLWSKMVASQLETGTPYLLFKDACNAKSNQQNIGIIESSNLCCEIMEVSTPDETAVCNLASVALPKFAAPAGSDPVEDYDYAGLRATAALLVRNLNKVIDRTTYPVPGARVSNHAHRPVAIGVQGLHDVYMAGLLPFESAAAAELNRRIFATLYYAAVTESCRLAARDGPYSTFAGSPASRGRLQYDLWGATPHPMYDWAALKAQVLKHGLRNSLLVALMPTASTASLLMNTECFEPLSSNLFLRRTLAGEYLQLNHHLVRALEDQGLWTTVVQEALLRNRGSVQGCASVPADLQAVFKTAYEVSMRCLIKQSSDRGIYVCQSSSKNLFLSPSTATAKKLTSMLFLSWQLGEKTGVYYTRTQPPAQALQVGLLRDTCRALPTPDPDPCGS